MLRYLHFRESHLGVPLSVHIECLPFMLWASVCKQVHTLPTHCAGFKKKDQEMAETFLWLSIAGTSFSPMSPIEEVCVWVGQRLVCERQRLVCEGRVRDTVWVGQRLVCEAGSEALCGGQGQRHCVGGVRGWCVRQGQRYCVGGAEEAGSETLCGWGGV